MSGQIDPSVIGTPRVGLCARAAGRLSRVAAVLRPRLLKTTRGMAVERTAGGRYRVLSTSEILSNSHQ